MSTQQTMMIIGGAVGLYFGNPALGMAIGSAIGGAMDPERLYGPRLSDLSVQVSSEGSALPVCYGAVRITGRPLQVSDKRERAHKSSAKGGPVATTYTYSMDVALELCEGPIIGVRRIWANKGLIYDASGTAGASSMVASGKVASGIRVYLGSSDQLPDPSLEALTGVGSTPAYRNKAYIVLQDLQLQAFGNNLPSFEVEVIATGDVVSYRRLAAATIPQAWRNNYWTYTLDTPTIFSVDDIVRAGVAGDVSGVVYLYDLDGRYLGLDSRKLGEGAFPRNILTDAGKSWWGVGRVDDGAEGVPLYFRDDYRRIIGAGDTLAVQSAFGAMLDASGGLPAGRQLLNSCLSADGRHIFSVTAPAGSTFGSGTGDQWHITRWTGTHAELVKQGVIPSPVYEYLFGPGSPSKSNHGTVGMMESNLEYIWSASLSGFISLYQIVGEDLVRIYRYAAISGGGAGDGFGASVGDFPSLWADAGLCITLGASGFNVHTRLPALEPVPVTLSSIVADLCRRSGLADAEFDVSQLTETCHGYAISSATSARACIEPLQQMWPFDAREEEGRLVFIPRGGAPKAVIPWADLAAHDGGEMPEPLDITGADETELPTVCTIIYPSPAADYQIASQREQRNRVASPGQLWPIAPAVNSASVQLAVAMTDAQAARAASVMLWDAYTARRTATFSVTLKYANLYPGDPVQILGPDASYNLRIRDIEDSGLVRKITAVFDDAAIYQAAPPPVVGEGIGASSISLAGPTRLELLDIPILRDADDDAGFYAALGQYLPGWPGGSLYASADNGATWTLVDTVANSATLGTTIGALGGWSGGNTWDETNTVVVQIPSGLTLESLDPLSVLNGGNAAAIGNEIVQFRTATLIGPGQYRLAGLLRGRKGTEDAVASHADGDRFVLLDGVAGLLRVPGSLADIGKTRLYRAVTAGAALEDASEVEWTNTARGLKPLAPVSIAAGRDASGNVLIRWVRRSRIDADWRDSADAALGEAAETYEVDILNGVGGVVRTLTTSTPSATYYADDCIYDLGGMVTSIPVRVYQISAKVGRGMPGLATLSLPPYSRIVDPFFAGLLETSAGNRQAVPLCAMLGNMVLMTTGRKLVSGTQVAVRRFFYTSNGTTWTQAGADIDISMTTVGEWFPSFTLGFMAWDGAWMGYGALLSSGAREFVFASSLSSVPVSKGAAFAASDPPLSISYYSGWYVATESGKFYKSTDNGTSWTLLGTLPAAGPMYRSSAGWVLIAGRATASNPTASDPQIYFTTALDGMTGWSVTLNGRTATGYPLAAMPQLPAIDGNTVYLDVWGREYVGMEGATITRRSCVFKSTDGGATWAIDMAVDGDWVGAAPAPFVPASRGPVLITTGATYRLSPLRTSTQSLNQALKRYGAGDWRIVATTGAAMYIESSLSTSGYAVAITGLDGKPVPRYSTDGLAWRDPIVYLT